MTAVVVLVLRIALALALYLFLGWTLFNLWRDLKQQGEILASQRKPGINIVAVLEDNREIRNRFFQTEITIGRDPNCDFPIMDEAVSAHHARVSFHHSQWWLEDLNSTNGTFIGKNKVALPTVLIPGDQFKCGNTGFTVQMEVSDNNLSPVIRQPGLNRPTQKRRE
jgi:pSer/pThr/pTyr-binding forkhead associated (FHA) protein